MVFPGSRPAVWTMALALTVCQCGAVVRGTQDKPAPASAKDSSAARADKSATAPKPAAKEAEPASQGDKAVGKAAPSRRSSDSLPPPQVMSKAAADAKRPRSPFLMPPIGSSGAGGDRYNFEGTDWSEISTWRQTSFFGLRARGQFFVFVVDQSRSMIDDDRLTRAKIELLRSVFALQPPQQFEVIFYNEEATPMPGGPLPRPADLKTKNQLTSWLHLIGPDGGTDPRPAMAQALTLQPDAVFLLSDGEFPEGTVERVAKLNLRKVPIHCVDMTGGQAGNHLQRIARDSGGQYASRPGTLQATP
jgi:von Willebrand factor type A domain